MSYIRALVELISSRTAAPAAAAERFPASPGGAPVLIRLARDGDSRRLRDLADLDSASPLAGPALIALVAEEPWAAVSLHDGRIIADPFRATAPAVALLRVRASQLVGEPAGARAAGPRRAWRRARA